MALKLYKPTSPARRHMSVSDFAEITKTKPEKKLTRTVKKTGGRNNHGHITTRHIGGGHKRRYRLIDWKRNKDGVPGKVAAIEYDPNRTARIALLHYADGEKRYILAPLGVNVGDVLLSGDGVDIRPGNALPLKGIPLGTVIHNIESQPGSGAKMVRTAGSFGQLMAKEGGRAQVRMPSGEVRQMELDCRAVVGQLGNIESSSVRAGSSAPMGRAGNTRTVDAPPASIADGISTLADTACQ